MIETLTVESFKSIQSVTLELGQVNVFIGANGSGKSNLLEALAVLSAAASGKVDQSFLNQRGCRASRYYRPMFDGYTGDGKTCFYAKGNDVSYNVSLKAPPPFEGAHPWEFSMERWNHGGTEHLSRPDKDGEFTDPQVGLAALRLAEMSPKDPASHFLKALQAYSIYLGDTAVLVRKVGDPQERAPIGLSGGRLAEAVQEMDLRETGIDALNEEFQACVDWFSKFTIFGKTNDPSRPNSMVKDLEFEDRFFRKEKGYRWYLASNDVNEGVLYLAFLAVLGLHPDAPQLLAIENVDHGLNPLLAKRLIGTLTERILSAKPKRQVFLTTHNPLVLDGLPLGDDRVRLFTVDRDNKGYTLVKRFIVTDKHRQMAEKGWTLSRMWINKLIGGVPDV